jgi:Tfp pilus assembly protein PilO
MLAAVAGLLCVGGVLLYMMASGHLKSASAALADRQKQVDDSNKIASRLETARSDYVQAESELCFLETSVSTYAYVPTLLGQLERLGKAHNLKVISVRPQPTPPPAPFKPRPEEGGGSSDSSSSQAEKKKAEKPKPYEELKIDIELQGTYWCVHDFLFSLTRFPKIVAVREVCVAPVSSAALPMSPQLRANLVVTAFIFKPEAGNVETSKPALMPPALNKASVSAGRSSNEG